MAFIEFNSITKRFPGVLALDRVSFGVERGRCHAVMGETSPAYGSLAMPRRSP
ncbi:MAG: hypothetical protein IH623_32020 [Verrucomicrobia bacterium]|nr:hypothetical protein [Verrucomicrobiota bacterium]